ncbi:DUF4145 domain-containing protein [Selenomonas sp. FC4001]|uniref:DUF4145 domain-containing protein n=1 Tax=Selenomonas sp. FC4001 TaxID=1408313 RepID=UPI000568B439|nr:DUF4145 domain-containing protein [Selenomonas sp. FC4001]
MSNFNYLQDIPEFTSFADLCIQAENTINMPSYSPCVIQCRVALEKCIKFIYSKERYLMIYDYNHMKLSAMLSNYEFRKLIPLPIQDKMHKIRKKGNKGLHNGIAYTEDVAIESLRDLFDIVQWIDQRYNTNHTPQYFSSARIDRNHNPLQNDSSQSNKPSLWRDLGFTALGSVLTFVGLAILGKNGKK